MAHLERQGVEIMDQDVDKGLICCAVLDASTRVSSRGRKHLQTGDMDEKLQGDWRHLNIWSRVPSHEEWRVSDEAPLAARDPNSVGGGNPLRLRPRAEMMSS